MGLENENGVTRAPGVEATTGVPMTESLNELDRREEASSPIVQ